MSRGKEQFATGHVRIDGVEYIPTPALSDLEAELAAARKREGRLREVLKQCEELLAGVVRLELSSEAPGVANPKRSYTGHNNNMPINGRVWEAQGGERLPLWHIVRDVLEATAQQAKDDAS